MKKLSFAVFLTFSFFHPYPAHCQSSPANSGSTSALSQTREERVDALEKKVDRLESSVEEILQLLKNQQQPVPTNPVPNSRSNPPQGTSAAATPSGKDRLIPGAKLEAWPLPANFQGTTPPGMSMGAIVDSGTLFNFDNFLSEEAFKPLKSNLVGLKWSGFIQVNEPGDHNFILERDGVPGYPWFVSLKINDQGIISKNPVVAGGSDVATMGIPLEPGFYKFELFTYFNWPQFYPRLQLRVKMRSESSLLPVTLDADSIFHKP
jgi:hypothetical protein